MTLLFNFVEIRPDRKSVLTAEVVRGLLRAYLQSALAEEKKKALVANQPFIERGQVFVHFEALAEFSPRIQGDVDEKALRKEMKEIGFRS